VIPTERLRAVLDVLPSGGWIDGAQDPSHGNGAIRVENPSDRSTLADLAGSDDTAVDRAVASATESFRAGPFASLAPAERGRLLWAIASMLRENRDDLAVLESADTGKPLAQARNDADAAARYFEFYAGVADKVMGETIPLRAGELAYTTREPYGVVAHILPWNAPLSQLSRGVAPSLAAGNTVVIKPSQSAPLSTLFVAQLFSRAGLPPGVANVVVGGGSNVGQALAGHPDVGMVTFTGSVETGRSILAAAAQNIVPCNLELGGKSAAIVLADADIHAAVQAGVVALTRNCGQSCFAMSRFIVHRSRLDEYIDRIDRAAIDLTLGASLDDPDLGPLISAHQLDMVLGYVERARADGAAVTTGGDRRTDGPAADGYFMAPTVLADLRPDMQVVREEVFGPVQSVLAFDDEDEAVALANDTPYGLAAAVFTRGLSAAHRIASRLEAGQVHINGAPLGGVETPFGGFKQSGIGREKGLEALSHYTQTRTVIARIDQS
jgi:acyl-CoA reductase-like NAD-dependent aldehyde dehydrogenase